MLLKKYTGVLFILFTGIKPTAVSLISIQRKTKQNKKLADFEFH